MGGSVRLQCVQTLIWKEEQNGRSFFRFLGEYYAVYSPIVGANDGKSVSAQAAYKNLCVMLAKANEDSYDNSPLWFNNTKWNGTEFETAE